MNEKLSEGRLPHPLTFLLGVGLLIAAFAAACSQQPPPRFPHLAHVAEMKCGSPGEPRCLSCSTCHTPSQDGRLGKLPPQSICDECHGDRKALSAQVLRANPDRRTGDITFDHSMHLTMEGIGGQCVPCHGGVVGEGSSNLPPMATCFSCHEHQRQWDNASCSPCHLRADLEKTLPVTFLRHDESFFRHHASFARTDEPVCMSCHTQKDCQTCHDGTQMLSVEQRLPEKFETKQVHRGDFLARHAIEAASQPASCMRCHETASCDACHVERGVSGNAVDGRNPHPPGWIGSNVGSSDFHGRAARRDLLSCAGCHEAGPATNCIRCHKVGAYGGNPHPGGWQSVRGTGEAMCSYCHEGGI